jgi:hypothetical protein
MIIRVLRHISLPLCLSLLVSSCITIDNQLGQGFIPEDQILSVESAVFPLPIYTKSSDSLFTATDLIASEGFLLFGSCYDSIFGATHAGAVIQYYPSQSDKEYGEQPEPISLKMTIISGGSTILDPSQAKIPQNVYVHRMLSDISAKHAYNNALQPEDWDPVPLSQAGQVYFGSDTLVVDLSLDFARELLNVDEEIRKVDSTFVKTFKGIYLRTQDTEEIPNSGRLNAASFTNFWMTLTYRTKGAETDSVVVYMSQSSNNFNAINHVKKLDNAEAAPKIYFQGLAGAKPYIDFVALKENINAWAQAQNIDPKRLLVSHAEIILPYSPQLSAEELAHSPDFLFPSTREGADTTLRYYPIIDISAEYCGGNINRSQYHYSFIVTRYLQQLLKTDTFTQSPNTWLMSVTSVTDGYTSSYLIDNLSYTRLVFEGAASNSPPILKLTYAVLK